MVGVIHRATLSTCYVPIVKVEWRLNEWVAVGLSSRFLSSLICFSSSISTLLKNVSHFLLQCVCFCRQKLLPRTSTKIAFSVFFQASQIRNSHKNFHVSFFSANILYISLCLWRSFGKVILHTDQMDIFLSVHVTLPFLTW